MRQRKEAVAKGRRGGTGQLRDPRMCRAKQSKEVVADAGRHPMDKRKATDEEGAPDSWDIPE